MKKHLYWLAFVCTIFITVIAQAETVTLEYTNEIPRIGPDIKPNIYLLSGDNSTAFIRTCHYQTEGYDQYWLPSKSQITIVDKKIVEALKKEKIDWKSKRLRKLYFGLMKGIHAKQIYALVFMQNEKNISSIVGNNELDCLHVSNMVRFDINSMQATVL